MQIGERIEKGDIDEDFLNLAFSYILTVRQWNGKNSLILQILFAILLPIIVQLHS